MKRKQLPPCLFFTGVAGVLRVMANLADVVQMTGVPQNYFTTDIGVKKVNPTFVELTARKVES